MPRSTRVLIAVCATGILTSCDADVLAPNRRVASGPLVARAVGSSLNAWTTSPNQITVSWTDDSRNEAGWQVHRSITGAAGTFSLLASLPANTTSHDNTGLTPVTEYCYKVRSFRTSGKSTTFSAFTNVACATTYGPPPVPRDVNAVPRNSSAIEVRWTESHTTEQGYRVERSASAGGPWESVATLGGGMSPYVDGNRASETQVCYRVVAFNQYGESVSGPDCTAPPQVPSNSAASASGQGIDVTWTDASGVEDGYEVQHAPDGSGWSVLANLPAGSSSYRHAAVTPDVRHLYRVRAKRDGGFSDFSGEVWAAVASAVPQPPLMGGVSPSGSTGAAVQWSNVGSTTMELRLERSTDGRATWVNAGTLPPDWYYLYDGGRTPESEVCYRVFARNSAGESGPSGVDCTIPLAHPTDVTVTEPDESGTVLVSWSDNSNVEAYYEVWYLNCWQYWDCYSESFVMAANATSVSIGPGNYFEAVYACADGGCSDAGTWAGAGAGAGGSSGPGVRPTKGARVPRAAVIDRLKRVPDNRALPRRPK